MEIARKLKLPRPLRDIIEQHHGNSLVRYFYQRPRRNTTPNCRRSARRTTGTRVRRPRTQGSRPGHAGRFRRGGLAEPQGRRPRTASARLITDIINSYLQDGQLDDCDFSLRDLRTAAASFFSILYAVYHPRVEYPGFEFEGEKGKTGFGPPGRTMVAIINRQRRHPLTGKGSEA